MLAGVGPVPAVLLVIAADEGWCRQTAEHVAALDALAVTHGVLAITQSDLGDPAGDEEARDYLQGPRSRASKRWPSTADGSGVDELRDALQRMLASLPPGSVRRDAAVGGPRLHGARRGTVVTGTLGSGHQRRRAGAARTAGVRPRHPEPRLSTAAGVRGSRAWH